MYSHSGAGSQQLSRTGADHRDDTPVGLKQGLEKSRVGPAVDRQRPTLSGYLATGTRARVQVHAVGPRGNEDISCASTHIGWLTPFPFGP